MVWELCHEDVEEPGLLGEVTVSPAESEISLSAPTTLRADRLLEALPAEVRGLIGALRSEDIDVRDVLPRCRRDRISSLA